MEETKKIKIAVVHDHLGFVGGGERTVLLLALGLGADFITAYANPNTFPDYQKELGGRLKIFSKKIINLKGVRFFWIRGLFLFHKRLFREYDLLIVSGHSATDIVGRIARPHAAKILYIHNPPRRVYDQYEQSKSGYPAYLRPFFSAFVIFWKWLYLRSFRCYDFTIANSEHIRDQVVKYTGYQPNAVIWPPILSGKFRWIEDGDYFISWARVEEIKRVELIVRAFLKMPDEKLIVASSGSRLEHIKEIARNSPNIQILGWTPDDKLFELVGRARAAIYIPENEDAGITHLEANAAGKPVLGVREGGMVESVVEGVTGALIEAFPDEDDLIGAVRQMTGGWCAEKRIACEEHAENFDEKIFIDKMRAIVMQNDPRKPVLGIDASRWEDPRFPGEGRRTGVEVVACSLIKEIIPLAQNKGLRARIYTPSFINELPLDIQKVLPAEKRWTRTRLSPELKHNPPDYFFTPSYYLPKNSPKSSFAIVHDVLFRSNHRLYSLKERLMQEYALNQNLTRSKKIITVSEFSKKEINKYYKFDENRIIAVPLGYEPRAALDRVRLRENKIFFVGRIEKKKSVDVLIHAFAKFIKDNPDWRLVLAGGEGYGADEIKALIVEHRLTGKVELPGFISDDDKFKYLVRAKIFVHPSANEGSCIPLFEAWDAQTPAIISDAPVMREVGGEGALNFRAGDADDLAQQLDKLARNENLQEELINKGVIGLQKRSWKKAAEEVMDVILGG
jgi:glycosyltransferase involved in cell wall biosynthesis